MSAYRPADPKGVITHHAPGLDYLDALVHVEEVVGAIEVRHFNIRCLPNTVFGKPVGLR